MHSLHPNHRACRKAICGQLMHHQLPPRWDRADSNGRSRGILRMGWYAHGGRRTSPRHIQALEALRKSSSSGAESTAGPVTSKHVMLAERHQKGRVGVYMLVQSRLEAAHALLCTEQPTATLTIHCPKHSQETVTCSRSSWLTAAPRTLSS